MLCAASGQYSSAHGSLCIMRELRRITIDSSFMCHCFGPDNVQVTSHPGTLLMWLQCQSAPVWLASW